MTNWLGSRMAMSMLLALPALVWADEKVYSVKETVEMLQHSPDVLKDRKVKVQGYYVDGTKGIGCHDFMILVDKENAQLYKSLYDPDLTPDEFEHRRQQVARMPTLHTGQTLVMPEGFFPTQHGIYVGHFYDPWATKTCEPDGWKRFVIEMKAQEIVADTTSTYRTKTVTTGLVIHNGKHIPAPYEVTLKDYQVTINGVLDEPPTEAQLNHITEGTDQQRQRAWEGLVSQLEDGRLILHGGNKYERSIPTYSATVISDIEALMKSARSERQKRQVLADLLDTFPEDTTLDDILRHWNE